MTHLTEVFPAAFSYGSTRRPLYSTTVVRAASGMTERNSHWDYPLHIFNVPLTNRSQAQQEDLLEYWHAAGGQAHTFNMIDPSEDRTCSMLTSPSQSDQSLGAATAGQTDFQLVKAYTRGGRTQYRKITRPIDATVLIEVNSVLQTVTTDYTIDALGVISFVTPMTGGEIIKWGGRFYTPVAFGTDDVSYVMHNVNQTVGFITDASIDLIEVRE